MCRVYRRGGVSDSLRDGTLDVRVFGEWKKRKRSRGCVYRPPSDFWGFLARLCQRRVQWEIAAQN